MPAAARIENVSGTDAPPSCDGCRSTDLVVEVPPPVPPAAPSLSPRFLELELALTLADPQGRSVALPPIAFRWGVEPPPVPREAIGAVLAASPSGRPRLAWRLGDGTIETLAWTGEVWASGPATRAPSDAGVSLAAGDGTVVVAARDWPSRIGVLGYDGTGWQPLGAPFVPAPGPVYTGLDLAVDAAGRAVLAFDEAGGPAGGTRDRLHLLRFEDGGWRELAASSGDDVRPCFGPPSLALDAGGRVLVAYQDATCDWGDVPQAARRGGDVHVKAWDGGALREVAAPLPPPAADRFARPAALVATAAGPVVSAGPAVARWDGARWVDLGAPWPGEEIDRGQLLSWDGQGDFRCAPELAALSDGSPVVACEVAGPGGLVLKVRRHDGTRWVDVGGFGDVGFLGAKVGQRVLAVDPQGGVLLLTDEGYVVRRAAR